LSSDDTGTVDTRGLRLPTAEDVAAARVNIRGRAIRTPLLKLNAEIPGTRIYLKLENLQPFGSFKIRPALNVLKSMPAEELRRGVLTASAGNFGQGLAFAAREIGVPITVVVPETSAAIKTTALADLGATVIRVPFDEWWATLTRRSFTGTEGVFVHPVAESGVVAGNATIGAEIIEDLPNVNAVVVPFGGGGLVSGIGSVMRRLGRAVRMVAAESAASQPAAAALAKGRPVTVRHMQSFVDGMGSTTVLAEMWPLVRDNVDEAVCVSFAQISDAIRVLAVRHHVIAEAAGAASVAAAMAALAGSGDIVCIVSGGNIDAPKLGAILNGHDPF
jgi:threonine dehydratase